jgi:hypothetical protein
VEVTGDSDVHEHTVHLSTGPGVCVCVCVCVYVYMQHSQLQLLTRCGQFSLLAILNV